MSRYVEVNDEIAAIFDKDGNILVEDGVKFSVPSMRFVEAYFGRDLGVLPPAVRWISDGTPMSVLFERPPEPRVLSWDNKDYLVMMPWLLYMVTFQNSTEVTVSVHARTTPLYNMTDEIFEPPLPRRDANGTVVDFTYNVSGTLGDCLNDLVQKVFEHMDGHSIPDEHVPQTWGQFSDMESLLAYWTNADETTLVMETEFVTSPLHSVEALCQRASVDTDEHTSFSYLESIIRTLALEQNG